MYCYVFFGLTFNVFEVCCHRVLGPRLWYCHLHQLHLESIMGWRLWQRWLTFSMNFAGAVSRFQRRFWPFFLPQSTKVSSWMRAIMLRSGALIFRSPFFSQGLVVKHGLFNILNVKIDCTISMTFQKAPKVNEWWTLGTCPKQIYWSYLFITFPVFICFTEEFFAHQNFWGRFPLRSLIGSVYCNSPTFQDFHYGWRDVWVGWFFWIVMEPWLRLNGNNFASLQLKERILVPTISTMTYSGKPQQKSKAKRSWKIWMEKTTWTRTSEKMEVRNVFEVTKGQDFQWHQKFCHN